MLSINNFVVLLSDHREHAWALRTIGQDLADLRPEYLEIEFTGRAYVARGRARRKQAVLNKRSAGRMLGTFKRPRHGSKGQRRENGWFERRYTLYDISRLDDQGLIGRKNRPTAPDIYVLGERLRTVGKMIEAKDGQLRKLTLDNHRVAFTYCDATATLYHEEHSVPALYRTQQDGRRSRGTGRTRDPWSVYVPRRAAPADASKKEKFTLMPGQTPGRKTRWEDDET